MPRLYVTVRHTVGPVPQYNGAGALVVATHAWTPDGTLLGYAHTEAVASTLDRNEWVVPLCIDVQPAPDTRVSTTVFLAVPADNGGVAFVFDGCADATMADITEQHPNATRQVLYNRHTGNGTVTKSRGTVTYASTPNDPLAIVEIPDISGTSVLCSFPARRLATDIAQRAHTALPLRGRVRAMVIPLIEGVGTRRVASSQEVSRYMESMSRVVSSPTSRGFYGGPVGMYAHATIHPPTEALDVGTLYSALQLALLQYGLSYDAVVPRSARITDGAVVVLACAMARYLAGYMPYCPDQVAAGRRGAERSVSPEFYDVHMNACATRSGDCDKLAHMAAYALYLLRAARYSGTCADSDFVESFLPRVTRLLRAYRVFIAFVVVRQSDARFKTDGCTGHAVCVLLHERRVSAVLGGRSTPLDPSVPAGVVVDATLPMQPDAIPAVEIGATIGAQLPAESQSLDATMVRVCGRAAPFAPFAYAAISHLLPFGQFCRDQQLRDAFGDPEGVYPALMVKTGDAVGDDLYAFIEGTGDATRRVYPICAMTATEYRTIAPLWLCEPPAILPSPATRNAVTADEQKWLQRYPGPADKALQWLNTTATAVSSWAVLAGALEQSPGLPSLLDKLAARADVLVMARRHWPSRVVVHVHWRSVRARSA